MSTSNPLSGALQHMAFPTLDEIAKRYDTDKSLSPGYIQQYTRWLEPLREQPVVLLELGVDQGGSLLMWRDYFPQGHIVGLDQEPPALLDTEQRIRIYQGQQQNIALLDRIAAENAPHQFDIIIDDAAHIGALARQSFQHLFIHHLKPGGIYVIEDWGTGYWQSFPDGATFSDVKSVSASSLPHHDADFRCHNFGMVGFIKELVDECAASDITHPQRGIPPARSSTISQLIITHGMAWVFKASVNPLSGKI